MRPIRELLFETIRTLLLIFCFSHVVIGPVFGAGVTIITHGLNGKIGGWVVPMAERLLGTNALCYEIRVTEDYLGGHKLTYERLSGPLLKNSPYAEIVIKLDWSEFATLTSLFTSSSDIAEWVTPALLDKNFLPELGGHSLVEFPIHLIGHSRGGSVVSELSRLLGAKGVWIDHLTFLDPHPLAIYGDASVHVYRNVLFSDDYFQTMDFVTGGEAVPGSYLRQLVSLEGGYSSVHSDTHLWYHGTIDLSTPASYFDRDEGRTIVIDEPMRESWWRGSESHGSDAGFHLSRIRGGDRTSLRQPSGLGTSLIRDGFNRFWDLGAGMANNRTPLPTNNGEWPNVLKLELTGTNLLAHGQSSSLRIFVHWARPASTNATVELLLDDDFNPYNGNEIPLRQVLAPGTGADQLGTGNLAFTVNQTNVSPGYHSLLAKMTGGGHSRYIYAAELLTVISSFQPPFLRIAYDPAGAVEVEVVGVPGQRIVLEAGDGVSEWTDDETIWLTTNRWTKRFAPVAHMQWFRAQIR